VTVVVSAGGTREPIDAVRFVGNRASGRMGVALATEARRRGATVTLLAANLAVDPPAGVEVVETPTVDDMLRGALERADADVVVMAAAPADYRPADRRVDKRLKDDAAWAIELEPTPDVLRTLGEQRRPGQVLVGFAADHGPAGLARAREKLDRKNADLIVYNDVSRTDVGFDSTENEVTIVARDGERTIAKAPKSEIARDILDAASQLLRERERAAGV
jgi:phosphopantothenoylcysteine decarboxylase/phosphopantothenate--cysteine ligase